ncbi:MAG TPA: PAS domain-containing protein, partial [Pyrinomonadaceae bacterium]
MTPTEDPKGLRDPLAESHLRRVLDAVPTPVSYVGRDLRFRYNNRAYDAWVGRPHEELYGTHVRESLGEKAYREVLPHMEKALSGREAHFEREFEYADGARRYVSVSYIPDFGPDGEVHGFVAHVRDLTERR